MKILFVFNHPAPYKINLLNQLSKYYDLHVIFERDKNKNRSNDFYYVKAGRFNTIDIGGIDLGEENHLGLGLKRYIKKHHSQYDLIIMNGYSTISEILALKYMIKHNIPYILYVNGGIIKEDKKWRYKLKRELISNAKAYFSPCKSADEYLIHYGAEKNKIHNYIYSTLYEENIQIKEFDPKEKQKLRDRLSLPANKKLFVYSGQFISRKNNLKLLKIFKNMPSNYHLTLIGDGEEREAYIEFIHENDMYGKVAILPYLIQPVLLKTLRAFDYFITLSKEDIYGHMINEALSQRLPVISSSKVMAALNLINDRTGILVDPDDETAIIKALDDISKINPEECVLTAKENTIEKMIESHVKIIKELEK